MKSTKKESKKSSSTGTEAEPEEMLWSMSAVQRMTGIGHHTLRAWERRFGFPVPIRLPSKHRRFTEEQIERLKLIAKALQQGHRAGDVVPLTRAELLQLLEKSEQHSFAQDKSELWIDKMLEFALAFDGNSINKALHQDAASMGVRTFLHERVEPLLLKVGEAWASGAISIRHEHYLSEILGDVLRVIRKPLEANADGSPILLTTFEHEGHSLGLQIVALLIALHGFPLKILGAKTPISEIVASVESIKPMAIGISVSIYTANQTSSILINELHQKLPKTCELWIGGAGATRLEGIPKQVKVFENIEQLDQTCSSLKNHIV